MENNFEFSFSPLPPLSCIGHAQLSEIKLPDLKPLFFVPPLEDRPQNPIVEAISDDARRPLYSEPEEEDTTLEEKGVDEEEDIWVYTQDRPPQNHVVSWDALGSGKFPRKPAPSPFLSEQPSDAFDAVRHYIKPRIDDPTLELRYVLPIELLQHLLMNILGNSSRLYIWHSDEENFVPLPGRRNFEKVLVIVEGLDSAESTSIIDRFLNIGTKFRRLEIMVMQLKSQNDNSALHALRHALSTLLVHLRTEMARRPPYPLDHITSIWAHYAEYEELISALAFLCHRHQDLPYDELPASPAALLSHIYSCLEKYIDRAAPRKTIAALAYVLTATSKDYFREIGELIGLGDFSRAPWLRLGAQSRIAAREDLFQDNMDQNVPAELNLEDKSGVWELELPSFFPKNLVEAFPVARKSLSLLHAANPEHELSIIQLARNLEWVWTEEEVERLWMTMDAETSKSPGLAHTGDNYHHHHRVVASDQVPVLPPSTTSYPPELENFKVFDLEPGTHVQSSIEAKANPSSFLASFPPRLPSLAPKLSHLAELVLEPLTVRTTGLSNSLLKLFLGPLQLQAHLEILKAYLLVTHYPFKRRLVDALFEDEATNNKRGQLGKGGCPQLQINDENYNDVGVHKNARKRPGIGLSSGLAQRGTWPPGGLDLSFFLRSVVVDSINEREQVDDVVYDDGSDDGLGNQENVWKEAKVRLGFALRDLPVGDGKEGWLNPMCELWPCIFALLECLTVVDRQIIAIEALDFLYLDYKPPHPINVIITPAILSKYQRVFTFVLRLFRAEMVARIAYRCTFKFSAVSTPSKPRTPIFSYALKAQTMLVDLRFQIQAFLTSFAGYIFDSAIRTNLDSYLVRLSKLGTKDQDVVADDPDVKKNDDRDENITDVFALRDSHSQLLDRILSACLLRTAQRPGGDALRDILDVVLQFGALLDDLRKGVLGENEGAEQVEEVYWLFKKRMIRFIEIIQTMHAKEQDRVQDKSFAGIDIAMELRDRGYYGSEPRSYLEDLLTRIDPTRWWRRILEKGTERPL